MTQARIPSAKKTAVPAQKGPDDEAKSRASISSVSSPPRHARTHMAADPKQDASSSSSSSDSDGDGNGRVLQYKVIVLGDGAVGKTSLCNRFANDYFAQAYKQTVGLEFYNQRLKLQEDLEVVVKLWDIGGQSINGPMVTNYIFGAQAVLLTFDVTNYLSFQSLEEWYQLVVKAFAGKPTMPQIVIVANKADLQHMSTVKSSKLKEFASAIRAKVHFVSARTGDNVQLLFSSLAASLAGVVLSSAELQSAVDVVKAEIVNHPKDDPNTPGMKLPAKQKKCAIM